MTFNLCGQKAIDNITNGFGESVYLVNHATSRSKAKRSFAKSISYLRDPLLKLELGHLGVPRLPPLRAAALRIRAAEGARVAEGTVALAPAA